MSRKTISVISYLTLIGWLISFVMYHNGGRSSLVQYHLRQSFGLGVFGTVVGVAFVSILSIVPIVLILFEVLGVAILSFLIFGIMNAINQRRRPIPLIGAMFVDRFHFIEY